MGVERVEGAAQVDPEGIVRGAGKDVYVFPTGRVGAGIEKRRVVHGARADVGRHGKEWFAARVAQAMKASILDHGDRIALALAETGTVEIGDSRRNHQGSRRDGRWRIGRRRDAVAGARINLEQVRQALLGIETKLEDDVLLGVVIVVYLDLIQDFVVKREPVRSVARFEQRVYAQDKRDARHRWVAAVTAECIDIGDVCLVVECGDGCFAVIGGLADWRDGERQ